MAPRREQAFAFLLAATLWMLPSGGAADADGISLQERLDKLQEVYREQIRSIGTNKVVMSNGSEITIDDGRPKSFEQKLADADINDMLSQVYPVVGCVAHGSRPAPDFDPGRIRNEAFFKSIYGGSRGEVAAKLVPVDWFGQKLLVMKTLGINEELAAVAKELTAELPALKEYLVPSAGTFNWRPIAGTSQLSTHSYGIAIDISTAKTEYWRWSKGPPGTMRTPVPERIVAAFERHGFIWGGNWYHFDTMHFEYRPELIAIGNLAKDRGCVR